MKELNEAKVLAVGPGGLDKEGKRVAPSVAPGDKVLIPQVSLEDFLRSYIGMRGSKLISLSMEEVPSKSEMRNTRCSGTMSMCSLL